MIDQQAEVTFRENGTPVSTRFDDPYYSVEDGFAESCHVFIEGNDLAHRLKPGFSVAELGFGTGLNAIALASIWPGPEKITFTSFEAYPMSPRDLALAVSSVPLGNAAQIGKQLVAAWNAGETAFPLGSVDVRIILGDARDSLPNWSGDADAWFLDGFAPSRNPELWEPSLLTAVARHTRPNGTFATYTAAGPVRRALSNAGFEVTRKAGFGRKRHMTVGMLRS